MYRKDGIRTIEDLRLRCIVPPGKNQCWTWTGTLANATPSFRLPALGRAVGAGVGVCFLTTGETPAPGVVWHRTCDNPRCVAPHHRHAGTRKSQMARVAGIPKPALTRAKIARTRRQSSKLSQEAVDAIRASLELGKTLAARYGISIGHACRIKRHEVRRSLASTAFSGWNR